MNTKKIITLTLLVTSLTLQASLPHALRTPTQQQRSTVAMHLTKLLFQRGIEEERANELTQKLIEDEELFSKLLKNYLNENFFDAHAVYAELSNLALKKQKVDFTSYAFLIKLTQKIHNRPLEKHELETMQKVAQKNSFLSQNRCEA